MAIRAGALECRATNVDRGYAGKARDQRAQYERAPLGGNSEGRALRLFGNEQREGVAGSRGRRCNYIEREIEGA